MVFKISMMAKGQRLVLFVQVAEMKKELVDLQPKLEQAKIDNTKMMKVTSSYSIITSQHQHYSLSFFKERYLTDD